MSIFLEQCSNNTFLFSSDLSGFIMRTVTQLMCNTEELGSEPDPMVQTGKLKYHMRLFRFYYTQRKCTQAENVNRKNRGLYSEH